MGKCVMFIDEKRFNLYDFKVYLGLITLGNTDFA